MKFNNILFEAFAFDRDGVLYASKLFCTEEAMSKWANRQYRKDEGATVKVFDFKTDKLYCTYHA